MKRNPVVALALVASLISARGAVLQSDPFDYADGSLVTASAGKWTNHSGTLGELKVISGRAFVTQTSGEDVGTPLAGGPYGTATNAMLYAGFTVNCSSPPSGAEIGRAHV